MRRPPRQILLPAVAFLVLLTLALGAVVRAEHSPRGALYASLRDYLEAVEAGDTGRALALAPDFGHDAFATHVEALQGLVGHVQLLAVSEDGLGGEVRLAWLDPRGRGRLLEILDWTRSAPGIWRLARIEIVR